MSGVKHDTEKCRMDLIPPAAENAEAWVWTFGATKYGDRNWENGIKYSRLLAAVKRHTNAMLRGELIDPESGLPHAACIRCSMGMILHFEANNMGPVWNDLPKEKSLTNEFYFGTVKSTSTEKDKE